MRLVEGIAEIDDLDAFLARAEEIADEHGVDVQAFDARYVVGREHLERAVELADRAIERGENVARDRAVEILLYAAGRRQIDQSLEMGVSEGRIPVVVLVDGGGDPDLTTDGTSSSGDETGAVDEISEVDESDETAETSEDAAAVAVGELLEPAATLGEFDRALVCEFFDVGEAEIEAVRGDLSDLVLERVSLLEVEK
ncbi:KEOPS complex subunit Cgi121 [Halegenticoccus soli]|uniref:KEOPS complex subunit Cgi121 n=1 Tax=Halegenticoccus soli TaxID=1985678 RepID=UPI000C6D1CBD|nr:KEOPS complex subunit Cgi121 [Halegenticoccus soli]